jgi:hypothetical protein
MIASFPPSLINISLTRRNKRRQVSLSTYFPAYTQYFYGYPAGEDSGFINWASPSVEELVAARAFSCAGQQVSVVGFAATSQPVISHHLLKEFAIPQVDADKLTLLPEEIDSNVRGAERNELVKDALTKAVPRQSLVMAQPFTSDDVVDLYQIPPKLIRYLNDKSHMNEYIPADLLPKRHGSHPDGAAFALEADKYQLPFVVKAASSSAGDGVYMCVNSDNVRQAVDELRKINGMILVEEFIEVRKNYAVHFGIPSVQELPIDIIGVNEQLTTPDGAFIGGIIESAKPPAELHDIVEQLRDKILPRIRSFGWYGVGGFDILADANGGFYFIDCNFRMTGMTAYHFLVANDTVTPPLLSFAGSLKCSQTSLEDTLLPYAGRHAKPQIMQLIALSRHDDCWNFNGAVFFNDPGELLKRIQTILGLGVTSDALEQIARETPQA